MLGNFRKETMKRFLIFACVLLVAGASDEPLAATASAKPVGKIILDTDIGDDIDDAFALALALRSAELEVVGITTAWGDTALRAKLANRLVREADGGRIPVLAGIRTQSKSNFTQSQWANEGKQQRPARTRWNF